MTMKKLIWILLPGLLMACSEELDTNFERQRSITTDYPIEKRIFYNEVLAQGETLPGATYAELGFYISEEPFDSDNGGQKYAATEFDQEVFRTWIGDLKENTSYYIRAYGREGGDLRLGETVRIRTSSTKIEYVTLDNADDPVASRTSRQQLVRGVVTDAGGDPDGVIEYGAYCWPASADPDKDPSAVKKVSVATEKNTDVPVGKVFEVQIGSLTPQTDYHYRIYARNNRRERLGEEASFRTAAAWLPAVRTNAMLNVATTLCQASGTVTDIGNDPEVECGFYLGTVSGTLDRRISATDIGENYDFELYQRGLTKETRYYLQAFVKNFAGEALGEIIDFTTDGNTKPELKVIFGKYADAPADITETSVTLYTEIVSDGGMEITDCGVYWGESMDALSNKVKGTIGGKNGDIIEVKVEGLRSGQVVYYRSYAVNSLGETRLANIESTGTKLVVATWENAGKNVQAGAPNNFIRLSSVDTDTYYEMPPLTVTEADGKVYRYYFLDRNLGAKTVCDDPSTSNSMDLIGYNYVYSYSKPGSVPSTGVIAQAAYGWINANPLAKDCMNWNDPKYSPAPASYAVPTRAEWTAFMNSLPAAERNLTGAFKAIRLCKTGIRPKNGGVYQKTIQIATVFAADNDDPTGTRAVFQTRDADSDVDFGGKPYMTIGVKNADTYISANISTNGGTSVRCFRKMEVKSAE